MYDQSIICLQRQEIDEIMDESKNNLLIADYARIFGFLNVIVFLLFLLFLQYMRNELVKAEKLNTELVLLFNKIQEDKLATDYSDSGSDSGPEEKIHPSKNNSDSDESI